MANELTSLVQRGAAEALRENAQLLWGNRSLIVQAEEVHAVVLGRWPSLGQQCAALRISLAAYGDAIEAAAGRLIEQAGTTRALGFLPAETWVSFARRSDVQALAAVLDSFVFDAPAPWLSPQALAEAVESARPAGGTRFRPPRPDDRQDLAEQDLMPVDDTAEPRIAAERLLGDRGSVSVAELLDEAGDWPTGRRLVAEMIAIHHHPDLSFELRWGDGLRIDPGRMVRAARQGVSVNQTETALWWARARAAGPQRILPGGPAPAGMLRLPEPDGSGAWLLPVLPDNASAAVLDELGLPGHVLEHPNDTAQAGQVQMAAMG